MIKHVSKKITPFFTFPVLVGAGSIIDASADNENNDNISSTELVDANVETLETIRLTERIKATNDELEKVSLKTQKLNLVLRKQSKKLKLVEDKKVEQDINESKTKVQQKVSNRSTTVTQTTETPVTVSQQTNQGNLYGYGWCTWGVKQVAPWVGNNWGNAYQWAASASSQGFQTGTTPKVGSVIVWSGNHVAYVTHVRSDGYIQVLESNYNGNTAVGNYRGYFNPNGIQGTVTYIYPKA